jgi:tetratricopeptide (TPR) repeat protein
LRLAALLVALFSTMPPALAQTPEGQDLTASAACKSALSGTEPLSSVLLIHCSDEKTAGMVQQLLENQGKQAATTPASTPPLSAALQQTLIKRQVPELLRAVQALRGQGTSMEASLSERQAAASLFQGNATSAVNVLERALQIKDQVALSLRRQGVLLRTFDAPRAATVLARAVAENPNDFELRQQAADSHTALGADDKALPHLQKMLALAQAEVKQHPADNAAQGRLAGSERDLAACLARLGKPDQTATPKKK